MTVCVRVSVRESVLMPVSVSVRARARAGRVCVCARAHVCVCVCACVHVFFMLIEHAPLPWGNAFVIQIRFYCRGCGDAVCVCVCVRARARVCVCGGGRACAWFSGWVGGTGR